MEDLSEKLVMEFEEFSISVEDGILGKIKEFCVSYGLSAEDMVGSWVAFSATKNINIIPSQDHITQFEREELSKLNKLAKSRKSQGSKKKSICDSDLAYLDNKHEISVQRTPESQKSVSCRSPRLPFSLDSSSPLLSTPSAKYASRKAPGEVLLSFGSCEAIKWMNAENDCCTIAPFDKENALLTEYKYMFEKLRDYGSVLNDMIDEKAIVLQKAHDIPEWGDIHLPAMEPIPVVGRICVDGTGKLNSQSLLLEGSQETSSGHILPLDVSQLQKYSFYPGQLIAGLGMNSDGKKIVLKELYENPPLPFPVEVPCFSTNDGTLSVVIAAGPFTTSDSLSYEPLADLMTYLKTNRPHLCIMCGPLVDIHHEEIQRSSFPESYEDVFKRLLQTISTSLEGTNVKIVLVSSLRDAHHVPVYPVPPFLEKQFQNIYFASDPCILNVDGAVFGVTSTDILLHLGKEEISFPPQCSDRLGRLCSHILNQRNFYPLYPPSESVNIDFLHFEEYCSLPVAPHVLIVPSDLRYFVKDVQGCCFINPERLTKWSVGGTFVRVVIKNIDPDSYKGSLIDHIQAEILKI